jgi:hypothetical protein
MVSTKDTSTTNAIDDTDEDYQLLSQLFDSVEEETDEQEFIETDDGNPVDTLLEDNLGDDDDNMVLENVDDDDEDDDEDAPSTEVVVATVPANVNATATASTSATEAITLATAAARRATIEAIETEVITLALADAFKAGEKKMTDMDYVNSRHRSRKRTRRERQVLQDALYFFVQKMGNNYGDVKKQLKEGSSECVYIPDYRNLVNDL